MHLKIDGKTYTLAESDTRTLVQLGQAMALQEYRKLDDNWQFLSKPIARTLLQKMEEEAKKKGATKEEALTFRPPKKTDPTEHLLKILSGLFYGAVQHVELSIETDSDSISSLACSVIHQSESGGPLDPNGDIGFREDNGIEVPGRGVHAALSNDASLCP